MKQNRPIKPNREEYTVYFQNRRNLKPYRLIQSVIILSLAVVLLVGCFGELLLPDFVGGILVHAREGDVKHLRVPVDGMALDVLFNVLCKR